MAEKDTEAKDSVSEKVAQTRKSDEDIIKDVEEFLEKVAKLSSDAGSPRSAADEDGATGSECGASSNANPQSLTEKFKKLALSKNDGEIKLPNNAPPFSDFVPKPGKDLNQQLEEHNRKKHERQQRRLKSEGATKDGKTGEEVEDSDVSCSDDETDPAIETATGSSDAPVGEDSPFQTPEITYPTLTQLIFGESFNMEQEAETCTPDKLRELIELLLPKDGEFKEEEGIPMPQDDSPISFDMSGALGPEKLRILHEMLRLYDEEGLKHKGLFEPALG